MPFKPSSKPGTNNSPVLEGLRVYKFHGIEFSINGKEAIGDCPFCGKEQKFSVNTETSQYQCWAGSCKVSGNSTSFLKSYWEHCRDETTNTEYDRLAEESGFLQPHAARAFGVVMSTLKNQWLIPGWNKDARLTGLYRYGRLKDNKDRWFSKLLVCPGTGHHLFNLQNYDTTKPIVDLCEGWRDGIAWYESLTLGTRAGKPFINDRSVLAVPGTNSFKPEWSKFFAGKTVNILFDNDHPVTNKDKTLEGAGLQGVKKVASILSSAPTPPETINFVAWNGSADQYSLDLPDSTDVRDYLKG